MKQNEFRALFDAHLAFVWRVLARHGVARHELEDGCQEVFVVVHRRLSEFEGRSSLRTWLYGVAVRVALGMRRRAHRRREWLVESALEAPSPAEPFDVLQRRELQQQLMAALASLSPRKREVFVLYELEEMSMTHVAQALSIPESTALSRLYGAREAIATSLRKQERAVRRPGRVEVA